MCRNTFGNNLNFTQLYNNVEVAANLIGLGGRSYKDVIDSVKFSLYAFKETEKVLNCKKGLTISEFFTKKDIILNVEEETNNYLLMTFLIDLLSDIARYHRFNSPSNTLNTLVCGDECRRIIPPSQKDQRTGHDPGAPVKDLITSSREDGMGYALGTQEISSVPEYLISNAAYKIAMLISGKGRKDVQQNFNLTKEEAAFMDKFPKYGTGIMSYTGFDRRFLVDIPSDLDDTHIPPNKVREMMKDKIKALHEPIYKAMEQEILDLKEKKQKDDEIKTEKKIRKISLNLAKKQTITKLDAIVTIEKLLKTPFLHKTQIKNVLLNKSSSRIQDVIEYLTQRNLVVVKECWNESYTTSKTSYLALTDKVKEYFDKDHIIINPARFKHTLYLYRVNSFLKFKGYDTKIEYTETDKQGFIDILAIEPATETTPMKRIAYEITLSFSNLIDNVLKCLDVFKLDDVHIVTESQEDQSKAMNRISNSKRIFPHHYEQITYNLQKEYKILKNPNTKTQKR